MPGAISCAELHFSFHITNFQGYLLDCFGDRGVVVAEAFSTTAADASLSMTAGGSTDHSTMASSVRMDHVWLHGCTMEDGPEHRFLVVSRTTDLIKASSCSIVLRYQHGSQTSIWSLVAAETTIQTSIWFPVTTLIMDINTASGSRIGTLASLCLKCSTDHGYPHGLQQEQNHRH